MTYKRAKREAIDHFIAAGEYFFSVGSRVMLRLSQQLAYSTRLPSWRVNWQKNRQYFFFNHESANNPLNSGQFWVGSLRSPLGLSDNTTKQEARSSSPSICLNSLINLSTWPTNGRGECNRITLISSNHKKVKELWCDGQPSECQAREITLQFSINAFIQSHQVPSMATTK